MAVQKKDGVMSCLCSTSVDLSKVDNTVPKKVGYFQVFDITVVGSIQRFSYAGVADIKSELLANGYRQFTVQIAGNNHGCIC